MSTLLWMISFLLHGISILAIYLLLKDRQNLDGNKQTEKILKETLVEIQRENRMLQNLLAEEKKSEENLVNNEEIKTESFKSQKENKEKDTQAEMKFPDIEIPQSSAYQDEVETSLEAKVLQLHTNGETIDDIAKKLNCGKTEAEIIIKMYQKKS
ncbi:DUF6115 domain-containing protein [Oceanobacillus sojae]|uniref:DUF6115 domain-containing protein n=1 Tax=Oceanobacillus sojae TaxID=582851 RepID=UPI0009883F87|nr:hypothetical protein [Oceanobacillus sojae]MCT1903775.1 hypothetical protein [Oceanobacillus sojae]